MICGIDKFSAKGVLTVLLDLMAFMVVVVFLHDFTQMKTQERHSFPLRQMSASGTMRGILTFRLGFSIGRASFVTFLPLFVSIYLGLSSTLIGVLLATNLLLMSGLEAYGGTIADKVNRAVLVSIGGIVMVVHLVLVPLGGSFWQMLSISVLGGIAGALAIPATSALAVGEGRKFGMGSTMAVYSMSFSIGMIVGPLLSGAVADALDIRFVFWYGGAIVLIGTGLFGWFCNRGAEIDNRKLK